MNEPIKTPEETFFCNQGVAISCFKPIKERFQVLLDKYRKIQQNVADDLNLDKAYISRIFNGVQIPPHHVKLKIAAYFEVDTSVIWRTEDIYK